jgi:hypothetical protein
MPWTGSTALWYSPPSLSLAHHLVFHHWAHSGASLTSNATQVKYKIGEDLDLKEHVDDSEVTLNVSLGKSFAGSALISSLSPFEQDSIKLKMKMTMMKAMKAMIDDD